MKKQHLPQKICVYCQRPFDWRKKWERCWEEVKYALKDVNDKPAQISKYFTRLF
ncbi:DUF2256 domain-containing protein [Acinetobacter seifertii]|nr:DUF2256 domain-containing protein [Acinetobacter seifertii]